MIDTPTCIFRPKLSHQSGETEPPFRFFRATSPEERAI